MTPPEPLTTGKAAAHLGISQRAVMRATERGYLHCEWGPTGSSGRARLFVKADIDAYKERQAIRRNPIIGRPVTSKDGLLTTTEVAALLGIQPRSVRHAAQNGYLPAVWDAGLDGVRRRLYTYDDVAAYRQRTNQRPATVARPFGLAERVGRLFGRGHGAVA